MYEESGDIVATKDFLGHSSVSVTERYIKKDKKDMERLVKKL